jgi:phage shock protein E
MRKITIILLSFIVSAAYSCTNTSSPTETATTEVQEAAIAKDVPAKEFEELIKRKENGILLDVRTAKEVAEEHLANSVNIDFFGDDFKEELAKLDKSKPVMVYCHSGRRSGKTVEILKELGFKEIYNLETGIVGWEEAGLPVVK